MKMGAGWEQNTDVLRGFENVGQGVVIEMYTAWRSREVRKIGAFHCINQMTLLRDGSAKKGLFQPGKYIQKVPQ
jgi:DNA integrity scanning protein DisA with diadenylate cyclase activity